VSRVGKLPVRITRLLPVVCACLAGSGCSAVSAHRERPLPLHPLASTLQSASAPPPSFSPQSFWNQPLPADVPLDPSSAAVVAGFGAEIEGDEQPGHWPWINTTSSSVPIYTVPARQPRVRVRLAAPRRVPSLESAWRSVPLPSDAQPAAGNERVLVVWQPSSDRLWEFWRMARDASGWHARWGGAMRRVSRNPGVYGPRAWPGAGRGWGVSASSLELVGGLITLRDLAQGSIDHALEIAIPNVRAGVYASPAQRTDGTSPDPLALPEGAHLRLDPSLDLGTLHLSRVGAMIAQAAQRYGLVVRDYSPNLAFYAQDPTPTGTDPYTGPSGYFEGKYPREVLAGFPWSHLQLLAMHLHLGGVH
jgi:hypothetical protein